MDTFMTAALTRLQQGIQTMLLLPPLVYRFYVLLFASIPSLSLWPKKSHFTNEKFRLISKHHNLDSTHSLAHNVNVAHYALHFRHPNRKHNLIQFILFALFLPLCTSSRSL